MVKLTVFTAEEKRQFKEQQAKEKAQKAKEKADRLFREDRAKRIAFEQQRAQERAEADRVKKQQADYYNNLKQKQEEAQKKRDDLKKFRQNVQAIKDAKQKQEEQRQQLLNRQYFTDGLTQEELNTIKNMTPDELETAIKELEEEIKQDEQDEFEASRRRDVDNTDVPDVNVEDTDEEDDTPVNKDKPSVSKAQLQHALNECEKAYYPEKVIVRERDDYRVLDNDGAFCLVRRHTNGIPNLGIKDGTWEISFRGTHLQGAKSPTEDGILGALKGITEAIGRTVSPITKAGLYNVIADLNSHVISLDNAFVPLQMFSGNHVQFEARGITTVGFAKHLDLIFGEIMDVITTEPNYDIIVNGHSLGAVSAQLFALRLLLAVGRKAKRVYAFASPRGFDTIGTYVAENLEFIHVLDERDPITYMYPIFYESHAGFKIIQKEDENIQYLNDDEFVPWCIKDFDESQKVYNARQYINGASEQDYLKYWNRQKDTMNSFFQRSTDSFLSFIKQWQFSLNREATTQFINRVQTSGDSFHYIPNYRNLIEKLDDEPHFFTSSHVDYKGMSILENVESLGKEDLRFTDYWQLKSNPTLPKQTPEQTPEQQTQISKTLADYITPEMLVNGFIVYNENAKNKHENNFILY